MRHRPPTKLLPDQDELLRLFAYNPRTGVVIRRSLAEETWVQRRYNKLYAGKIAGYVHRGGALWYHRVTIDDGEWMLARVIWKMMTGDDPGDEIDHIDRNGLNNCWANLREVDRTRQMWNTGISRRNTSGFKGVSFIRAHGRWR